MLIRTVLLLLLGWTLLPLTAAADTLLVVGDSLSAAYGMPVQQGWVALLQKRLRAEQYPHTIINASVSGDTTSNARARLDETIIRHRPSIVLLELGGNDGLRGLPLGAMKFNLAHMIRAAHDSQARVLLIGVDLPPNYGSAFTDKFRAVYRQLANDYGVALLPSLVADVGIEADLMQADGIHPNAQAQPMIAERVWVYLQPLLDDARLTSAPSIE